MSSASVSVVDWKGRIAALDIRRQAFVDGRYLDAAAGKTFDDASP
jgi:hypothetical protein